MKVYFVILVILCLFHFFGLLTHCNISHKSLPRTVDIGVRAPLFKCILFCFRSYCLLTVCAFVPFVISPTHGAILCAILVLID